MILRFAAVAAVALLLVGCGAFTAPNPTAREMGDLVANLVRHGVTITDQVGGDAGCPDSSLYGNAVRYDIHTPTEPSDVPLYVLRWKSDATFSAAKSAFDACVASFKQTHADPPSSTYENVPWRVYGAGWSPALYTLIATAVDESAGASAPAEPQ